MTVFHQIVWGWESHPSNKSRGTPDISFWSDISDCIADVTGNPPDFAWCSCSFEDLYYCLDSIHFLKST